jgi:hypothetical protein
MRTPWHYGSRRPARPVIADFWGKGNRCFFSFVHYPKYYLKKVRKQRDDRKEKKGKNKKTLFLSRVKGT